MTKTMKIKYKYLILMCIQRDRLYVKCIVVAVSVLISNQILKRQYMNYLSLNE